MMSTVHPAVAPLLRDEAQARRDERARAAARRTTGRVLVDRLSAPARLPTRGEIAAAVAAFVARGGRIERVELPQPAPGPGPVGFSAGAHHAQSPQARFADEL